MVGMKQTPIRRSIILLCRALAAPTVTPLIILLLCCTPTVQPRSNAFRGASSSTSHKKASSGVNAYREVEHFTVFKLLPSSNFSRRDKCLTMAAHQQINVPISSDLPPSLNVSPPSLDFERRWVFWYSDRV
jgi:hypothetical protein